MAVAMLMTSITTAQAAHEDWETDFNKAKEIATKEKKDMLVNFSGSDWCGWCIKLDKEVFAHDAFLKEAKKNFVLVVLDFPNKPENKAKIPEDLQKLNNKVKTEFAVTGFPSVFLTDSKGVPYAKTGYQAGGPEKYITHLAEKREAAAKVATLLKEAAELKGLKRAKALDAALTTMDPAIAASAYKDLPAEIIELDKNNKAGLKNKYLIGQKLAAAKLLIRARKLDEANAAYNKIILEMKPTGDNLQQVWLDKGTTYLAKKDKGSAGVCLQAALAAAPAGKQAAMIQSALPRFPATEGVTPEDLLKPTPVKKEEIKEDKDEAGEDK